ncbi:MAG: UbiA family prenyltransferase [Bacteroidales bacterium]|nr:UbiA family prenyltransferase [Bacteroidales bacterium]MBN2757316.1 UbiA family prenyltransferase [Bacteroidales bacterium]
MDKIAKYFTLVKFSHTIFALPFALIGFFLAVKFANYSLSWQVFLLVVLCMVFARNAAMGFNRLIDKDIDVLNPRTSTREIPAGKISSKSALAFVIINSVLFIIATYFINILVFYLSPVALLVVLGYSYTKRFTVLCHFVLGLGLALAPIGAYLSVTGKFDLLPLLFSSIVFFWTSGFDIIYALQDDEFDKDNLLNSIPVLAGKKYALIISFILHLFSAILIIVAGIYGNFELWYWLGAVIFIMLLAYQHTIVKVDDLTKVNLAFFTTNGIASVIFAFFTILSLYLN